MRKWMMILPVLLAGCGQTHRNDAWIWPQPMHVVGKDHGWQLERGRLNGREPGASQWALSADGRTLLALHNPVVWATHPTLAESIAGAGGLRHENEFDTHLYYYDLQSGWRGTAFDMGHTYVRFLQPSPDGNVVVEWGDDGQARVWDCHQKRVTDQLAIGKPLNSRLVMSHDGSLILFAFEEIHPGDVKDYVKLWDRHTQPTPDFSKLPAFEIRNPVAVSPDHSLVIAWNGLWSLPYGRLIPPVLAPGATLQNSGFGDGVIFLPSGSEVLGAGFQLAGSPATSATILDVRSRKVLKTIPGIGNYATASHNGRWIISKLPDDSNQWQLTDVQRGERTSGFHANVPPHDQAPTWLADDSGLIWFNPASWDVMIVRLPKDPQAASGMITKLE